MLDRPYYVVRQVRGYDYFYELQHTSDGHVGTLYNANLAYHIIDLLNEEHREALARSLHQGDARKRDDSPAP